MTEEEMENVHKELSKYEKWMRNFRVVGSGAAGHTRKFLDFPPTERVDAEKQEQRLVERLAEVRGIVENFSMRGSGVSGSFEKGYRVGPGEIGTTGAEGALSHVIPPPIPTGACCKDGDCTIDTETHCISIGGEYQGDGTTCDEVDCTPLECPDCCIEEGLGFFAYDGSGRRYLTQTTVYHLDYTNSGDSNCANGVHVTADYTVVRTYLPVPCGEDRCACVHKCTGVGVSEWTCHMAIGTRTCTTAIVSDCQNPSITNCYDWEGEVIQVDGTHVPTTTPCFQGLGYGLLDGVFVVDSATERHQGVSDGGSWVQTLSDPCCLCEGYIPWTDGMGGYYNTRVDDCCGMETGLSGFAASGDRFKYLHTVEEPCDDFGNPTGSIDCRYGACEGLITCSGEIDTDPGPHCYVGCDTGDCEYICGEGCPPHIINTQTLFAKC